MEKEEALGEQGQGVPPEVAAREVGQLVGQHQAQFRARAAEDDKGGQQDGGPSQSEQERGGKAIGDAQRRDAAQAEAAGEVSGVGLQ